jgi:dTDP-4-dehydrorhamnose 3,5-epimerase-like enzyme
MTMEKPRLIQLPKIPDERGNLSFFENGAQVPFTMKRVYLVYDVPAGEYRGGHAYSELQEIIVALSGSFDVVLNDGREEYRFSLNRSDSALFVPRMIWCQLQNFSTNSLALIAADRFYDEADYIRDFEAFKKMAG